MLSPCRYRAILTHKIKKRTTFEMTKVKVVKIFLDDYFSAEVSNMCTMCPEDQFMENFYIGEKLLQVCWDWIRAKNYREIFQNDVIQVHGRILKKTLQ